jgi:hypothetical protein
MIPAAHILIWRWEQKAQALGVHCTSACSHGWTRCVTSSGIIMLIRVGDLCSCRACIAVMLLSCKLRWLGLQASNLQHTQMLLHVVDTSLRPCPVLHCAQSMRWDTFSDRLRICRTNATYSHAWQHHSSMIVCHRNALTQMQLYIVCMLGSHCMPGQCWQPS